MPSQPFLSGHSGAQAGWRGRTNALLDVGIDVVARVAGIDRAVDRLSATAARRDVLVLSAYRPETTLTSELSKLRSDRHNVTLVFGAIGPARPALARQTVRADLRGGKFENLNAVLDEAPALKKFHWIFVVDDDVTLSERFIDRFVAVSERLGFNIAQPAQSRRSHAAWPVTRRRPLTVARETPFVEIGPVTAFGQEPADHLLPFPPLRYGWGLDLHWAALAAERKWRLGVLDAVPVRHDREPVAASYDQAAAVDEARRFLSSRIYLPADDAHRTLRTYRRVPSEAGDERP